MNKNILFLSNLIFSIFIFMLLIVFNHGLRFDKKNTDVITYKHNFLTQFNRLDYRHWALPMLIDNQINFENIHNSIYLSSKQKRFQEISIFKYIENYKNFDSSQIQIINDLING